MTSTMHAMPWASRGGLNAAVCRFVQRLFSSIKNMKTTLLILAAALLATGAEAVSIEYDMTGTGSGTFNGTTFSDASFDLMIFGDTGNAFLDGAGLYYNEAPSATIFISGLGTFTLNGTGGGTYAY